jgi:hypothetical protein
VKQLLAAAAGFAIGYLVVTKVAPIVQARIESLDIDTMWDVYDEVWSEE